MAHRRIKWVPALSVWALPAAAYPLVYHPETVRRYLMRFGRAGQWAAAGLAGIYPPGAGAAVVLLIAVAFIPAFVRRRRPGWCEPVSTWNGGKVRPVKPVGSGFIGWGAGAAALILAVPLAYMLAGDRPPDRAAALWCVCLALGWVWARASSTAPRDAGGPFMSRRETVIVGCLAAAELWLIARDLTHWRWAGTPDEAHFFMTAKALMEGRLKDRFILSEKGVFGYHPVLSSYYQVLFMKVFGGNILGWRLSSAAAPALAFPGLYVWIRELFHRRIALMALILFGTTPLVTGFSHFGYNNVQVYLVAAWALGLGAWGIRRRRPGSLFLAGAVAGMGFHTYYAARVVIPLLILQTACLEGKRCFRRGFVGPAGALLAGVFLAVLPAAMHYDDVLANMVQQTAVTGGRHISADDLGAALKNFFEKARSHPDKGRFGQHLFLALFFGIRYKIPHHFQSNPILNPAAGILFLVGFGLCIRYFRNGSARFLLSGYIMSAIVVGAISQYDRPPLTRLLFLSPFIAVFGAVALDALGSDMQNRPGIPRKCVTGLICLVLAALSFWDGVLLYRDIYVNNHGYGDGTTGELIRMLDHVPRNARIVYVQRKDTYMECVDLIMDAYEQGHRFRYLKPFDARARNALASIRPPVVIFYDLRRHADVTAIRHILERRFPGTSWRNSDPYRPWNLPYLVVDNPAGSAKKVQGE